MTSIVVIGASFPAVGSAVRALASNDLTAAPQRALLTPGPDTDKIKGMTSSSTTSALEASGSQSRLLIPADSNFTDNGRKGRYGVAYLRSLAAHAGVTLKETSPDEDVDALDVTLWFGRASAEVQVKCSAQWKVGTGSATLPLEPEWVSKWSQSYHPIYVVLVKVPSVVDDWIENKTTTTLHRTVAFGKRFDPKIHVSTMKFTKADHLTSETLYEWRDQVYEFHEKGRGGAA